MSTTIRPEISDNNPYYIDKHRYYELKHFCLQYPEWQKQIYILEHQIATVSVREVVDETQYTSDLSDTVERIDIFRSRMTLIERTASIACGELSNYILYGITRGLSYEVLKVQKNIPCCKEVYYKLYRRFFWMLDRARK